MFYFYNSFLKYDAILIPQPYALWTRPRLRYDENAVSRMPTKILTCNLQHAANRRRL